MPGSRKPLAILSLSSASFLLAISACGKNSIDTNEALPDDRAQITAAAAAVPSDSNTPETQLVTVTRIAKAFMDVYYVQNDPSKSRELAAGDLRFDLDKKYGGVADYDDRGRGEDLAYMSVTQLDAKKINENTYTVQWRVDNDAIKETRTVTTTVAQEPGRGNWRVTKLDDPLLNTITADEHGDSGTTDKND